MPRFLALLTSLMLIASLAHADPRSWRAEWPETNFDMTTVRDWSEILSGGPPKDGIPAITGPTYRKASSERRIAGTEPVITLEIPGTQARAYPIRYLTWHEIVNDTVGGRAGGCHILPLVQFGHDI